MSTSKAAFIISIVLSWPNLTHADATEIIDKLRNMSESYLVYWDKNLIGMFFFSASL
jgi:hypothetical protein